MKTRSSRTKSPLRAGLTNVTNIKGNGRIHKTRKTAARCGNSKPATEVDKVGHELSSPLKRPDSHATPQKLTKSSLADDKASVVNTPRTPSSVFQAAKSAFRRCSTPAKLIGRTEEREAIEAFIQHHVLEARPGSLYISGCPGTGKTALLSEVCTNLAEKLKNGHHSVVQIFINCMNVSTSKAIYSAIVSEIDPMIKLSKNPDQDLEKIILPSKKSNKIFFVILDEIDQLVTNDNQVLYQLFEWASKKGSKLVLIGIANALNLTDRFLPRLKAKGCAPVLLNFNPYKVSEISAIIQDRLMSVADPDLQEESKVIPLMHTSAIEIAARKIASGGDLRKALDICRRAIEIVETEAKAVSVEGQDTINLEAPIDSVEQVPKVNIRHIMSASSSLNDNQSLVRLKALHTNLKVILLSMIILKDRLGEQQKLEPLFENYCHICKSTGVEPVPKPGFKDIINMLENSGLVTSKSNQKSKGSLSSTTLALNIRAEDVIKSCEGSHLLEKVIQYGKKFMN